METLLCKCGSCHAHLANFVNLWTQIAKSYFSPLLEATNALNIITQGPIRMGDTQTLVAGCELQDIACAECKKTVGLKCLTTPVNHVLEDSQILLKQASVLFLGNNGRQVDLDIRRTLKLRQSAGVQSDPRRAFPGEAGHRHSSGFSNDQPSLDPEDVDFLGMQAEINRQSEHIDMINTAGNQAVSKFDNSITRIDRDVKKLNGTMAELRRVMDAQKADLLSVKTSISDVKRNISEVRGLTHLENAMQTASAAVAEVTNRTQLIESENAELQEELQNTKKQLMTIFSELASAKKTAKDAVSAARKSANEVTNLRTEFEQLKQSLEQDRSRAYESKGHLFLPSELDILASNITKIGNRASLVEPLQMELDLFKSRVLRLEATMEPSTRERDRLSVMADGTRSQSAVPVERQIRSNNDGDGHGSSSQPRSRKRKAPSDRLPDCQGNVTAPKLTKSGAIDKRTIKRQEKNHPTSQDNPEEMPGIATPNSKRR